MWKEEYSNNKNSYSGQLPDGSYDEYATTRIDYCCRSDGFATNPIYLPTDSTFVLFKSNTHLCQQVRGRYATSEFYYWDCDESDKANGVQFSNMKSPFGSKGKRSTPDVKIELCYYHPAPGKETDIVDRSFKMR